MKFDDTGFCGPDPSENPSEKYKNLKGKFEKQFMAH